MDCPNCGTENDPGNRYCLECGAALSSAVQVRASPEVAAKPTALEPKVRVPPARRRSYGASGRAGLNIWGPFAGYGSRQRHVGWLLDGEGHRAPELIGKVEEKVHSRGISSTDIRRETLVGRGVLVESRPYFIMRRGLVSLALYVSEFGRDLFISMASYLKPPVSNFRVLLLLFMLSFQAYMAYVYPSALAGSLERSIGGFNLLQGNFSVSFGEFLRVLCVVGPLGLLNMFALVLVAIYSGYRWLTERDIWAALRVPPNEFNEDDMMAMEKAVEEAIRESLTELRLNPEDLRMATADRGGQIF